MLSGHFAPRSNQKFCKQRFSISFGHKSLPGSCDKPQDLGSIGSLLTFTRYKQIRKFSLMVSSQKKNLF